MATEAALTPVRAVAFDMHGVLIADDEAVLGAPNVVATLQKRGYRVGVLTNTSARTVTEVVEYLVGKGFPVTDEDVMTGSRLLARHLACRVPVGGAIVRVGGGSALGAELNLLNLASFDIRAIDDIPRDAPLILAIAHTTNFSDEDATALMQLEGRVAGSYTADDDRWYARGGGRHAGMSWVVAAVNHITSTRAELVGKPNATALLRTADMLSCAPTELLYVGDSESSDVLLALRAEALACRLGSPVDPESRAHVTIDSLSKLLPLLPEPASARLEA